MQVSQHAQTTQHKAVQLPCSHTLHLAELQALSKQAKKHTRKPVSHLSGWFQVQVRAEGKGMTLQH